MLPERTSLVSETIRALRHNIRAGLYSDLLPPERALSRQLQIGRNTLRAALQELEETGWIGPGNQGLRRRIVPEGESRQPERGPMRHVYLLSSRGFNALSSKVLQVIDHLRKALATSGVDLQVVAVVFGSGEGWTVRLQSLVESYPPGVWLLASCPGRVQNWFFESGMPALALGYAEEGGMPYVASDLEAVARHLGGQLQVLGHRHIALLQWGDALAVHSLFSRTLAEIKNPSIKESRIVHDGSLPELCRRVDRALAPREGAPTVLVVITPQEAVAVLTHLQHCGLRIPQDLSLVALTDDPLLSYLQPEPTHYTIPTDVLVKRVFDKLQKVWEQGPHSVRPSRIMCEFVKGCSLGPVSPSHVHA